MTFSNRFDNVDLGSSATMRRQIQSTVKRRHDDFTDVIMLLRNRGFSEAACVVEAMIEHEKKEAGL